MKSLHDARVGDIHKIGIEGSHQKVNIRIAKIVANDRLQDTDGNIFDRSGHIFRRKGGFIGTSTKGKIVFADNTPDTYADQVLLESLTVVSGIDALPRNERAWNPRIGEWMDVMIRPGRGSFQTTSDEEVEDEF